ncbi:MAG: PQQ-binding-like beta-propeller repeat protein, partial [Bryobacteraceae bacterium]|nr:PQQ-binding-like beta-propeller repeat protein [Bryobacteraceae bacterium]
MKRGFLALVLLPLAAAAQDWPQFRGNPPMTGAAANAPQPPLKQVWSWGGAEGIDSSPAIAGGAVYFGTQEGELVSLDFETGKLRWKYKANEGIGESSPAVSGGLVFVGDLAGVVHAVRAADGKGVWTFKTG